jgi:hypothetical protein
VDSPDFNSSIFECADLLGEGKAQAMSELDDLEEISLFWPKKTVSEKRGRDPGSRRGFKKLTKGRIKRVGPQGILGRIRLKIKEKKQYAKTGDS